MTTKGLCEQKFKSILEQRNWAEEAKEEVLCSFLYLLEHMVDMDDILQEMLVFWREEKEDLAVCWRNSYHNAGLYFAPSGVYHCYSFYNENGESYAYGYGGDGTFNNRCEQILSFLACLKYNFVASPEYSKNHLHKKYPSFSSGLKDYISWKESQLESYDKPVSEKELESWKTSFRSLWFLKEY